LAQRNPPRRGVDPQRVIPREGGVSRAPRPLDLVADVSGILDHPLSRIGVKVARASIDIDVFVEARRDVGRVLVCGGAGSGWLAVG
jgi:hypothetical protein